ncbi:MAG TPA: alcohol dehydrogenase catalytic domain-containing protein, partial [Thermoplasmata archaeon]|nr:alcohol dehydrogenase catalytic domain-containing protein [Thermoplasmata archaeon]
MAVEAGRHGMKGVGFSAHGGPEKVGWVNIPPPEPGPGEVRVRVHAAAFNRLDRFVLEGIPGVPTELPHVLGSDASGVVDEVGNGVTDLARGAEVLVNPGLWDGECEYCRAGQESLCRNYRILGEHVQGTATEFVVMPRRNVHGKPPAWNWGQAAAAPLVFQTAWRALRTVGELRPGETVAIIGAGGAVSPAAIQVAHLLGGRVVV